MADEFGEFRGGAGAKAHGGQNALAVMEIGAAAVINDMQRQTGLIKLLDSPRDLREVGLQRDFGARAGREVTVISRNSAGRFVKGVGESADVRVACLGGEFAGGHAKVRTNDGI